MASLVLLILLSANKDRALTQGCMILLGEANLDSIKGDAGACLLLLLALMGGRVSLFDFLRDSVFA